MYTCLNSLNMDVHEQRHSVLFFSLDKFSVLDLKAVSNLAHFLFTITTELTGLSLSHKHYIFQADSWSMLALIVFLLLELSHQWQR